MSLDQKTSRYRYVILGVTWITYAMASSCRLNVAPLSPFIMPELGLSRAQLGLFYSFTYIGYICAQIPAGYFADRFGVKWLLVIGQLGLGASGILMSTVTSMYQAWLVEFLIGAGAGSLIASTTKSVALWFPSKERATAMGIQQAAFNIGGVGGAILMPVIALTYNWRMGFVFLGFGTIASAAISAALFREPLAQDKTTQKANDRAKPTIRTVLANREIVLISIAVVFFALIEFCLIMNTVLFLSEIVLLPAAIASGYLAIVEGAGALGKPLFGVASDRLLHAKRKPLMVFAGIVSFVCSILTAFISPGTPTVLLGAVFAMFGLAAVGWGGLFLALTTEMAGRELSGMAAGFGLTMTSLGIIVGPPIFGLIVDSTGSYRLAWLFTAACIAVGTAIIALINEEKKKM